MIDANHPALFQLIDLIAEVVVRESDDESINALSVAKETNETPLNQQ